MIMCVSAKGLKKTNEASDRVLGEMLLFKIKLRVID